MVIEILSFSCFAPFSVTTDDGHLGMQNCKKKKKKKIKMASYKKHSDIKLDQYLPRVLKILSFS